MKIKKLKIISASLAMILLMNGCAMQKKQKTPITLPPTSNLSSTEIPSKEKETTTKIIKKQIINISAIGDCTIGTDITTKYNNSLDQYYDDFCSSYFFSSVLPYLEKDDITIANLECALTDVKTYANKQYVYGGKKEYAKILKDGSIEVVSLANNHSYDYLENGLEDTKNILTQYNIKFAHKKNIAYKNINGIRIAIISVTDVTDKSVIEECLELAKKNSNLQIVCIHWGKNYQENYNNAQEELGHYLVDMGADLILGTHPHILQGIETYKNVNIVYSLGNFCYGGKKYLGEENDTMIYLHTFEFEDENLVNSKFKIIPAYMSSSYPKNDYKPMVINDKQEQQRIIKKILALSPNIKK